MNSFQSTIMSQTTSHSATEVCSACKHWNSKASNEGECRRHSPQALVFVVDAETKFESRFPVTQASDWCGEFEKI
jgi:hypothetical protein